MIKTQNVTTCQPSNMKTPFDVKTVQLSLGTIQRNVRFGAALLNGGING